MGIHYYQIHNTLFILISLVKFSQSLETTTMLDNQFKIIGETYHSTSINEPNTAQDDDEVKNRSEGAKIMASLSFTLMGIIGITGNLLVMYAIWREPLLQIQNHLSNMAIFNLALTDLATTSVVSIPAAITALYDEYPFSHTFCRFCTFFNVMTIVATIDFLAVISIDRFILIKNGGVYPKFVTQFRFSVAMYCVWIACGLLGVGWIHDPDWVAFDPLSGICDVKWVMFGPSMPLGYAYGWYCTIVHFIFPTSAIIYCNVGIVRMVKKLKTQFRGNTSRVSSAPPPSTLAVEVSDEVKEYYIKSMGIDVHGEMTQGDTVQHESSDRLVRAMFVVMIVYIFLTAPVALIRIMKVLGGVDGPGEKLPTWIPSLCTILQFSASIVNPLIYGLFRKDFREAYYKIFSCK